MPHFDHQNPDGQYVHGCTDCGAMLKGYGHESFVAWICKCSRPKAIQGPRVTIGKKTAPAAKPAKLPPTQDAIRKATPCAFLGAPTGKTHKVGCVDRFLPEYQCLSAERLPFIYKPLEAPLKRRHVRQPVAIPGGRCRDLLAELGQVSCLDCPLYRAGLLSARVEGSTTDAA